jgi:hypothetical protein
MCKPSEAPLTPGVHEPQIRATVITIQTTLQPGNRTVVHDVVINDKQARSGDEVDSWRLLDLDNGRVTFVDDVEKTVRTESIATLVKRRQEALDRKSPDSAPRAEWIATSATRVIRGIAATQTIIRVGGYQRELWMAKYPSIPPNLFAIMMATQPPASSFAPMMKEVEAGVLQLRGFPMVDHAELAYGNSRLVVDRTVLKIEQKDVPQSRLMVPGNYRRITVPGERPQPAGLPPPGRSTRGGG